MTDKTGFTDEDLSQFLDDEASAEMTARIEDALNTDVQLQQRVEQLSVASHTYKQAFDNLLTLAPASPVLEPPSQERFGNLRLIAASLVAGAVLGLGLMYPWQGQATPNWKDVVASYQSLYVPETLTAVQNTPQERQAGLVSLSERLGFDLRTLPEIEGLTFVRSQELGYEGRPLAQLTFLTGDNGPVALCIRESP